LKKINVLSSKKLAGISGNEVVIVGIINKIKIGERKVG